MAWGKHKPKVRCAGTTFAGDPGLPETSAAASDCCDVHAPSVSTGAACAQAMLLAQMNRNLLLGTYPLPPLPFIYAATAAGLCRYCAAAAAATARDDGALHGRVGRGKQLHSLAPPLCPMPCTHTRARSMNILIGEAMVLGFA